MGYLAARLSASQPSDEEKKEIVEAIKTAILERCVPQGIFLFGSILTHDFTYASDIDVAILFADRDQMRQARPRLFASPPLISLPYDLLLYARADFEQRAEGGGICQVIRESGKRIL